MPVSPLNVREFKQIALPDIRNTHENPTPARISTRVNEREISLAIIACRKFSTFVGQTVKLAPASVANILQFSIGVKSELATLSAIFAVVTLVLPSVSGPLILTIGKSKIVKPRFYEAVKRKS